MALLGRCQEFHSSRGVLYVLAHTNDIVEECLAVEIGVLPELDIHRLYALYAVERQIVKHQSPVGATEQEPTVAELFQQVWMQNVFCAFACRE